MNTKDIKAFYIQMIYWELADIIKGESISWNWIKEKYPPFYRLWVKANHYAEEIDYDNYISTKWIWKLLYDMNLLSYGKTHIEDIWLSKT